MEHWDHRQLREYKPFVVLMVGNRRQGKSYLSNHLCRTLMTKNTREFDLVISFMGSAHCNPELHAFLDSEGFGCFQFNKWDQGLMDRLEQQQIELMQQGRVRNVLILVDDITLDHNQKEQLAHLCVRGRHFHVSVMMLSVSYSNFHKSCRRSSDIICLFSMGCQSDRELMMKEFAHKQHQCEFFMRQIVARDHTACIINLNEKQQKIYWYRAPARGGGSTMDSERSDPAYSTSQIEADDDGDETGSQPSAPERTESPDSELDPASSPAC